MRHIDLSLINENDPEIKKWKEQADALYKTLCRKTNHEERKQYLKTHDLWKNFKPVLIKLYGKKCWYSECDLTGSFGDIDHFRPKSCSKDMNGDVILKDGYWWLAYDYCNYRLSCEECNRPKGEGGKKELFPLQSGTQPAKCPKNDDIPLLLDPCVLSDTQLIDSDESGAVICLSENENEIHRVEISKKAYNWNYFNAARRNVRNKCKTAIETFEIMYKTNLDLKLPLQHLVDLISEKTPYSSFAKRYLSQKIKGKDYESIISKLI